MNLRTLQQFITVAEEKSILQAARKLYITQSALSRKIKYLECEVGVSLFERSYDGVGLTPAGKVFYEHAKLIIVAMHFAQKDMLVWGKK